MNTTARSKKTFLFPALAAAVVAAFGVLFWMESPANSDEDVSDVVVYKTASCSCCRNWVAHLRKNGLSVSVINVANTQQVQARLGVPQQLKSCHTAEVGDHWVEGHVPADLVLRLMEEKPDDIRGLAVPGMVMGSPGMEGPNPVKYQVAALGTDGKATVYATRQGHEKPQ